MNNNPENTILVEKERYEMYAGPAYRFRPGRRDFLKLVGAGLVVALVLPDALSAAPSPGESGGRGRGRSGFRGGAPLPENIGAWLHIAPAGAVTVFTGKVEMGQNIRTSLTQAVAEELRAPVSRITLVMGDTDLVPYDMGTFGSRTTPTMSPQLRKVGAAAREVLIGLAADEWKVDRAALAAKDGRIVDGTNQRSLGYGELAGGDRLSALPIAVVSLTPASEWTVDGTSVPKVDRRDFVTGRHLYTSDLHRKGMLYGKVVRPDRFNAKLVSVDASAAAAMPGVTVVHDGDFIGVAAPDPYTAAAAASAVKASWSAPTQPSNAELYDLLKKTAKPGEPQVVGDMTAGLAAADLQQQQTYTIAYIAHTPLEPRAALAEWHNGKVTVWTGTQRPFGVRGELAQAFSIPESRVRVLVPDTGSAYGGKHTGEAAVEAARLARAVGKPVKLNWTREEEFTWAYFRPAGVVDIHSGVKKDGTLTAWEHHNYNSGPSAVDTPYDVPNKHIEFHPADSPLRQGSYRALAATFNQFARESHMDELAAAVGMDPLAFRLKNLTDDRIRAVLLAATDRFGWGKTKPDAGHGFGLACGTEKGSYLATCAEVAVDPDTKQVHVVRAVSAFECGAVVNPEQLRSLAQGAAMMGIGGALFEAIQFANGQILNNHLSQYRVPRFGDAPAFDIVLVDRKDLPSAGAGETPIMGIAPAIGNAIASATGVRLRAMPLAPRGIGAIGQT